MAGDKTNSPDGDIGMQCVETKQTKQDKQNSVILVVKLLRAQDGCLGIGRRRRT